MVDRPKKIVIVDDDPETAEMLSEMVRLEGYTVIKSYGGESAIALIRQEEPDAVILDMMMPDVSGLEVLGFIRNHPHLKGIPVIAVSAKGIPADVQAGLDAGATVYLIKPVAFQELRQAMEQVILGEEGR